MFEGKKNGVSMVFIGWGKKLFQRWEKRCFNGVSTIGRKVVSTVKERCSNTVLTVRKRMFQRWEKRMFQRYYNRDKKGYFNGQKKRCFYGEQKRCFEQLFSDRWNILFLTVKTLLENLSFSVEKTFFPIVETPLKHHLFSYPWNNFFRHPINTIEPLIFFRRQEKRCFNVETS